MKKLQLPFGVQDYMPEECYNKKIIEDSISKVFYMGGYEKIETATLEYFDLFDDIVDKNAINHMFKMTDIDGSLLILRPDTTLQVCRMAATKSDNSPVKKYFYVENSFEFLPDSATARTREFAQAGLELLGNTGINGDIEVIVLAIESLLNTGLKNFLIDIGHIGYFQGIVEQFGIKDVKSLTELINSKDAIGIEMFLNGRVSDKEKETILTLPTLFGNIDILEKAERLCKNDKSFKAISDIKLIIDALKTYGYDKYISIDLGLLKGGYYSGVTFRGIAGDLGLSILDGGRYDNLCDKFNIRLPAVGFAIGIKRLLKALDNQKSLLKLKPCDMAYISDNLSDLEVKTVADHKKRGQRVIKLFNLNKAELIDYCEKNKIETACIFYGEKSELIKVKL